MNCFFCKKEIQLTLSIGRQEACEFCGRDLHICRNCDFYDTKAYNNCREPQADRVVEKERSNFCDYFRAGSGNVSGSPVVDEAAIARKKLKEMFK